jgi:hypothetical protein
MKGSDHLADLGVDGMIIKCTINKEGVSVWTEFS